MNGKELPAVCVVKADGSYMTVISDATSNKVPRSL